MGVNILNLKNVHVDYEQGYLEIIDQTKLPYKEEYEQLHTPEEIREAIYLLKVRGAPAIGIAAAYGMALCMQRYPGTTSEEFRVEFDRLKQYFISARPTAVNLSAAIERLEQRLQRSSLKDTEAMKQLLREEAEAIRTEDAAACRRIGELGLSLLSPGMGILTHCNAGHLAVSELGTALAPIYLGQEQGFRFQVYADETRPLLQGARLTAFELQRAGVDVTLICDNMAATLMQQGKIQAVVVGCDRVAANGDTANKIGTLGVAILAHHYHIPFYVLGPTSTLDPHCINGREIQIEERPVHEITETWYAQRMAPKGIKVYNPAFDVTPHELISAIITEKGIARPPFHDFFREWSKHI